MAKRRRLEDGLVYTVGKVPQARKPRLGEVRSRVNKIAVILNALHQEISGLQHEVGRVEVELGALQAVDTSGEFLTAAGALRRHTRQRSKVSLADVLAAEAGDED